ncbi:MAG: hypothetical protein AUG91_07090 [Actinobacteria bacterium 13_1_20CM_4_69_9]|nr:MAG: hypothetical protein AUG91_07090 [Actinobacteria bacterium 13_1_20CM_4_69_9]
MNIREIAPELWYWTAPHPAWRSGFDWPEQVGCVYYGSPEGVVLIDPLVTDEIWPILDERIARSEKPACILLTAPWHERSAPIVADRYGARIWRPGSAEPLPPGVEVFQPAGVDERQVAFFLPAHRTLVVAEFFLGENGSLRVLPSPALTDRSTFDASLRRLLDLPVEHVLVSHGEPVLGDGSRKIAEALHAHA